VKPVNDLKKLHAGDVENMGHIFHSVAYTWYDVLLKLFDMEFTLNTSQI
jgi:hypothetical protein